MNSTLPQVSHHHARSSEEIGAGDPRAAIREGGVGQLAVLPRWPMMRRAGIIAFLLVVWSLVAFAVDPSPALPSRDLAVVVPLLQAFTPGKTYKDVLAILGKEDLDTGSASPVATFRLTDGSSIHVSTRGSSVSGWSVREITLHIKNADESKKVLFRSE